MGSWMLSLGHNFVPLLFFVQQILKNQKKTLKPKKQVFPALR